MLRYKREITIFASLLNVVIEEVEVRISYPSHKKGDFLFITKILKDKFHHPFFISQIFVEIGFYKINNCYYLVNHIISLHFPVNSIPSYILYIPSHVPLIFQIYVISTLHWLWFYFSFIFHTDLNSESLWGLLGLCQIPLCRFLNCCLHFLVSFPSIHMKMVVLFLFSLLP